MSAAKHTPTPPNTNAPPTISSVRLSQHQIDALARFYELGLTPADKELLAALRELSALRNSHDALVAALVRGRAALAIAIKSNWEGATDADVAENLVVKQMDGALKAAKGEA